MRTLSAIKVTIGIDEKGNAKYPDFNSLQVVKDARMDWSYYVDIHGLGWHYDKTSGHKQETVDSLAGQQFGVLIAPKAFCDQAVAAFPECVSVTEAELEDFYDNKAHAHELDELVDSKAIEAVTAKQTKKTLTPDEQAAIDKALDPNDPTPGIRRNMNKRWADAKVVKGVTIE